MRSHAPQTTLRARLALWVTISTLFTLMTFVGVLYVALRFEERSVDHAQSGETLAGEASEQLLIAMGIAAPLALLVGVGGAVILGRRALAPLDAIVRETRSISVSELHRRLALPSQRDELYVLVEEFNELFGRLEIGFGALSRYAADASHELRTPLAIVAAELDVALRAPRTSEEWRRAAETSLVEIRRLSRLVDALLALARADSPLERSVRFDLREQVDQVLASLGAHARAQGIELSAAVEGSNEPVWIDGDPDALASAIRNIIDNAVLYTPAGGHVSVAMARDELGFTTVSIEDSGPGIPAAEREVIFSPLVRGASGERAPTGHGLGLAIARRIVARHRGGIAVEDSSAGGARFNVRVPRADDQSS